MGPYPESPAARDRWVLALRPERRARDPWRPYAFMVEPEAGPDGTLVPVATLFLTNRECPFRCVMCDLWQDTLTETVPAGAIAAQVEHALAHLPPARHLKLYNAGSFFDPRAIPPSEYAAVARLASGFERVIVECHPAFVGPRCMEFRDLVRRAERASMHAARLEVAIGLETAHPEVLARLNKRMTVDQFRQAAGFLRREAIDLRVFLLVRPPWLSEAEGVEWARHSLRLAWECGASVCSLIPTRAGNGAMEALAGERSGDLGDGRPAYAPPALSSVEELLEYGLRRGQGRVFVDLWQIDRFATCTECSPARIARLRQMNETQSVPAPVLCPCCGSGADPAK